MHEMLQERNSGDVSLLDDLLNTLSENRRTDARQLFDKILGEMAQPQVVVSRLARFLDASVNRNTELEFMASSPHYFRLFATLVDQSDYLTDILCRNPEYLSWLYEEVDLHETFSRETLTEQALRQVRVAESLDHRMGALRRFKRRQFLRIAARDLFARVSLRDVTEDLSNLADACLEAALWCACEELFARYGKPFTTDLERVEAENLVSFCILAFGKLGGRELNFSSDIDLVFLYAQDGETTGGRAGKTDNAVFFTKLGELIIKFLADETVEGRVFRVDVRLRPYGRVGPLAVSVDSAVSYYQQAARMWERQALVKARPAAGDLDLGESFLERVRPLVFPRFFDDETLEDIRRVKSQSEAYVEETGLQEIEVKRGRGGIRDIEFTVQMLQMLNGGRYPDLRVTSTLDAIRVLGTRGLLKALEADILETNYTFLRTVEHRLQVKSGLQTHKLPEDPVELDIFARRLGYADGESFRRDYKEKTEANRQILERFLVAEGGGTRWILDVLHPHGDGSIGLKNLEKLGFRTPLQARENLIQLYAGPMENPNTMRVRQQFTSVAPRLLEAISRCGDPDCVLTRIARLLGNLHASGAIYDVLGLYPHLCDYLVLLADNSALLTNILINDPGLFDEFSRPEMLGSSLDKNALDDELENLLFSYGPEAALYRFKEGNLFRIGLRDLVGVADSERVGHELTLLSDVCVGNVLKEAIERTSRRYGEFYCPFGILGLGKSGGRELGYGSDLDLIFVYSPTESAASVEYEICTAVAAEVIRRLKERTRHGVLYDVDARLRPYGKQGTLVISVDRLAEYYSFEAHGWERLALLKARCIAGTFSIGNRVMTKLRGIFEQVPLRSQDLDNILILRERLAEDGGNGHLKTSPGGMLDIEFIARLLEWRHVSAFDLGITTGTLEVLLRLVGLGDLSNDDYQILSEGYRFLRRVENRLRIAEGTSVSSLPEDPTELEDLTRRLQLSRDVLTETSQRQQSIRAIYERVIADLRGNLVDG